MATTIIKRSDKTEELTWAEMDQNLENLRTAIDTHTADDADPHPQYEKRGVTNLIGTPGGPGFGVGIAPSDAHFDGMMWLPGSTDPTSQNYGNYQYRDGSIMCWIPKFYYKIDGLAVDVKGVKDFASSAEAAAAGYALHRAFIDGGEIKDGFFIDKYMASKNAWGAGFIASSIQGGLPISTHPDHNPIAELTACDSNNYYQALNAAKARDGVDGAINAESRFFCASRFQWAALALLSLAHGQAAISTTYCAWYNPSANFPKGCNNNALGDTNDAEVAYVSDGYSNSAKTGSGSPFAKTTHNGQACGVADVNGLLHELQTGITCVAGSKSITAITQASPAAVTCAGHGLSTGDPVQITGVAGMTEVNDRIFSATVIDADTFSLDGVDSLGFAAYTSGGTATVGTFYAAAQATRMRDFTAGSTLATDHWGATGCAAMMEPFAPQLRTDYPSNVFAQRWGNAAEAVLDPATSGDGWLRTGLGFPAAGDALSGSGTPLFGNDYHYQYIRNELCLIASLSWTNGTNAGVWGLYLNTHRTYSYYYVGFRSACYPGA
jgi:hypothetical protein